MLKDLIAKKGAQAEASNEDMDVEGDERSAAVVLQGSPAKQSAAMSAGSGGRGGGGGGGGEPLGVSAARVVCPRSDLCGQGASAS